MKSLFRITLVALTCLQVAHAQRQKVGLTINPTLEYYLGNATYDQRIPKPQDILGYVPGEYHVTHDKLVHYMTALAAASDRITLENRGSTYEGRPLLLLTITHPDNRAKLSQIQTAQQNGSADTNSPVIIYQGFSIHGNEPSGSNASLLYAYHLAAATDAATIKSLKESVILLDPSLNPDGLQRFAGWVNQHKSHVINPDNNDREYDEVWPGGRTNHYWFDMNRDWLPVQLPESRARIKSFRAWQPHILTDHHEMGTNSSFFFQPGIPSRTHPLTPQMNQDLTREIGTYHASAFDKIGSLYYTEESFDDFYYGKGSTYPDINGGVGILFEQGSSRGHAQNSENGVVTFPFTIKNQLTAALSTLQAGIAMRPKLIAYQNDFYQQASRDNRGGGDIVFGTPDDPARAAGLAEIMYRQGLELYKLNSTQNIDGKRYAANAAYVVPRNQRHGRLLDAMLEERTTFSDSLFYDISAWSYKHSFDLNVKENTSGMRGARINELAEITAPASTPFGKSNYAYLISYRDYLAPATLYHVMKAGLRVKVAQRAFSQNGVNYPHGTLMIPVVNQNLTPDQIYNKLQAIAARFTTHITPVGTGSTQGIDLGSRNFGAVTLPKIAVLVGDGINPYDAGEIWHLMDQRYEIPITKLDINSMRSSTIADYTTIIVPATYGTPDNGAIETLKEWTRSGGNLIGFRSSLRWLSRKEFIKLNFKDTSIMAKNTPYELSREFRGAQVIGGALFETKLDLSHPIAYGYSDPSLTMFRNTTIFVEPKDNNYDNPIQYTQTPLVSGYISEENLEQLSGTVPFVTDRLGRGRVSVFTDNTNFRAFWWGTNKLMMNAIYFSRFM